MHFTERNIEPRWRIRASAFSPNVTSAELQQRRAFARDLFKAARVDYSVVSLLGGYVYRSGKYTAEPSMEFTLVGAEKETVERLSRVLCEALEQESVMVTRDLVEQCYLVRDPDDAGAAGAAGSDMAGAAAGAGTGSEAAHLRVAFDSLKHTYIKVDEQAEWEMALKRVSTMMRRLRGDMGKETTVTDLADRDFGQEPEVASDADCSSGSVVEIGSSDEPGPVPMLDYADADSYAIYVGLEQRRSVSDEETKLQAAQTVVKVLRSKAVAYSLSVIYGGYGFDDGFFEQESLVITLVGAQEEDVCAVAQAICEQTHQDVAMVTKNVVQSCYLTSAAEPAPQAEPVPQVAPEPDPAPQS